MEQTKPTTRAEEIAAKEYPDAWIVHDQSVIDRSDERAAFVNGYKQGQQDAQRDGWISVEEVKEILRDAIWGEHNRPRQEYRKRFVNQHGWL